MGTINYKRSDFITIGYNCNNIDYDNYEDEVFFIQEYYNNIESILNDKKFYYFHIKLEPGYYDGFSIDIEFNFGWCFDNYIEKREALKEVTQIKKFLLECINNNECCVVSPGWCTSYKDYKESVQLLNAAIKDMKSTVKNTPTYNRLPANEKI